MTVTYSPPDEYSDTWNIGEDLRPPMSLDPSDIWEDANYLCRDDLEHLYPNIDFDPESSCFYAHAKTEEEAGELVCAINNWVRNVGIPQAWPKPVEKVLTADQAELENLRRWKTEAIEVIDAWEKVWYAAGCPGPLGMRKSDNVIKLVKLGAAVESRREWTADNRSYDALEEYVSLGSIYDEAGLT